MSHEANHQSVLLNQSIDALLTRPDGIYVDATFGRGGHSLALFNRSGQKAKIIGIDRDQAAIDYGQQFVASGEVSMLIKCAFSELQSQLAANGIESVTGVLMDIGVSSPQLDTPERGFSFRLDGPLDMRMDQASGESAQEWVNRADVSTMARAFRALGEESNALKVAKHIARVREENPINTTKQLASIVSESTRSKNYKIHPATKVFQAIRMVVNDELGQLQEGLNQGWDVLEQGGRLAVISFHSLEDRMVKRFMRQKIQPNQGDRPWAAEALEPEARSVLFPAKPEEMEIQQNPRSRSARLRVVEKL